MLKRLDWDKERAERDARAFAERAIEVLPAEASRERSRAHFAAEMVLRDLSNPNRGESAAISRLATARLERMWHPSLNAGKRLADVPGRSVGKYWWKCVDVPGHDQAFLTTLQKAENRNACPACAAAPKRGKGRRRKRGATEKPSQSVWTVSGGLPTLGRRR